MATISSSHTVRVPAPSTVQQLMEAIEEHKIPRDARVGVTVIPRDRPFDSEIQQIIFTWSN